MAFPGRGSTDERRGRPAGGDPSSSSSSLGKPQHTSSDMHTHTLLTCDICPGESTVRDLNCEISK